MTSNITAHTVSSTGSADMSSRKTVPFTAESDALVAEAFKKSYVYRIYLTESSIDTTAKDGVVTLKGTVNEEFHKSLASETALGLPGVNHVVNLLQTKSDKEGESADAWIVRKINLALLLHRNVSVMGTEITSHDGVVTIRGTASSVAQSDLTAAYAADIEGVVQVKNEMSVSAEPLKTKRSNQEIMDDASIIAQIRVILLTHRSTSAMSTTVESRGGKVTLTGIAKNAAEKSYVTKLVEDVHGVTDVNNEMTVDKITTS